MITLGPVQSLAARASVANVVNCFVDLDTVSASGSTPDFFAGRGPVQIGTSATTLAAATTGQQLLVKSIALQNTSAAAVSVTLYGNGSAGSNQRFVLSVPASGSAGYEDGAGWLLYDASGARLAGISVAVDAPLAKSGNTLSLTLGNGLAVEAAALALAQMAAGTLKGNAGATAADPADLSVGQVQAMLGVAATPYAAQAYAATLTLPGSQNLHARCVLTGDLQIGVPTAPADGVQLRLWLSASGSARALSLAAGIVVPVSSSLSFPVSIAAGKKARLLLEYDAVQNGGQWEVASFINGY